MFGIEKPLPNPTEDTEAYWEAARNSELVIKTCGACGHMFMPPMPLCPVCWSEDVKWMRASGRGKVFSFIIVHRPQHPAFFPDAPYNVAIVELEEGPRMHARIVDLVPTAIRVGMPVEVTFHKVDSETTLPMFRPVEKR
jgi:uncharacterized OB-fold protein